MSKPTNLVAATGGLSFAAVAATPPQRIAVTNSKFVSGYAPAERPGPRQFNYLLGNVFDWSNFVDRCFLDEGKPLQFPKTLIVSPGAFVAKTGTLTYDYAGASGSGFNCFAPMPSLVTNKRITALRATILDNAAGPTRVRCDLMLSTYGVGAIIVASSGVSAGTGVKQTLSITGLNTKVIAGQHMCIALSCTTGSSACAVYAVEVDHDELT